MQIITILLFAVTLSLDALAVSVTNGITVQGFRKRHAFLIGAYFGFFQFLMPLIGWVLGSGASKWIEPVDHWVAFALLSFIGGRMVYASFQTHEDHEPPQIYLTHQKLLMQAIATSIDALAVGVSLAVMDVNIWLSCGIIGVVAFTFSVIGALAGAKLGNLFRKRSELVGGLVLIGIGIKILIEHLTA